MSDVRLRMDHLGVAVENLEEARDRFARLLGVPASPIEEVPEEGVRVSFFDLGGCKIELLEGTSAQSPVSKYLDKRRLGVHHISLALEGQSLEERFKELQSQGVEVIGDRPTSGSRGAQVFFIHPRASGGLLLELTQKEGKGESK